MFITYWYIDCDEFPQLPLTLMKFNCILVYEDKGHDTDRGKGMSKFEDLYLNFSVTELNESGVCAWAL